MSFDFLEMAIWVSAIVGPILAVVLLLWIKETKKTNALLELLKNTADSKDALYQSQLASHSNRLLVIETRLEEREGRQDASPRNAILEQVMSMLQPLPISPYARTEIQTMKRGAGRPPGSKNKEKTPGD